MLVRALKVLDYFVIETIGTGIDTAALDQPGDEGWAYGRGKPNWQRQPPAPSPDNGGLAGGFGGVGQQATGAGVVRTSRLG
jgi:hypothetical protein